MTGPIVAIDCSPLLVRSAGIKTYLYHWTKAMRALSPATIRTFLAPPHLDELEHGVGGPRTHPAQIAVLLALNRLPGIFCDAAIPRCDIFHISGLLRQPPHRPRLTATMHDLSAWLLPECHMPKVVAAEKIFAERVFGRAAGIMADSENTRRDAIQILGLSPEKIHVIHLGVPSQYFCVSRESIDRVGKAYGLQRPYLLFVGTIEPRKNVDTLLTAWEALPDSFRQENELVLAGMPGWRSEATMNRLLQANRDGAGVRYLNYVPEADLPALTAGAEAFVYPSLYEGFGIPVVQAMATGCPVITSNVSCLPEITGPAALLVDPRSVSELTCAIRSVLESAALRQRLRTASLAQGAQYTWQATAEQSLKFFASLQ